MSGRVQELINNTEVEEKMAAIKTQRDTRHWIITGVIAVACLAVGVGIGVSISGDSESTHIETKTQTTTETDAVQEQVTADQAETREPEQKTAKVGEAVPVHTSNGDIEVSAVGFVNSQSAYDQFSLSSMISDGKGIGILLMTVTNVSYDDQYNPGYVLLDPDVRVEDEKGVTISPKNEGYGYDGYEDAPGGFFPLADGQTKNICVYYVIDAELSEITLVAGDTTVQIPVTSE